MKKIFLAFLLSVLITLEMNLTYLPPAYALLRQIEESTGQMLYQARHSLRDDSGSAWQVVLFKRVKDGQIKDIHLRLVGFPEKTEFIHPKNLRITTALLAYEVYTLSIYRE